MLIVFYGDTKMINSTNIEKLSACDLSDLITKKKISPVEVIRHFKDRIEKRNESINAFVYTEFEYALKEAEKLEQRILRNEAQGVFLGVPFALKDFLPSKKGWTHTHGGIRSMIRKDNANSQFCKAMEKAGGIAIGKTNAPAFAFRGTCDNRLYGPTRNPFNTEYNSGGSSGGSAAAVADGLVPIAEGSDGGGSIRIPSAWCSCFGFKASVGTIPSVIRPDAWAATHPYCFIGGITKTVKDSAILLNYMAEYDSRDPLSIPHRKTDYTELMKQPIKGWKIAYTPDFDIFPVDSEISELTQKAVLKLEEAGAKIDHVHFNIKRSAYELAETWCKSISIDSTVELEYMKKNGLDLINDHKDELPDDFIKWFNRVKDLSILDFHEINLIRTEILDMMEDIFSSYDILISPVTICPPVRNSDDFDTKGPKSVNGIKTEPLIGFCETFFTNFSGHPGASVPAGLTESGLPFGMQITGKKFRDGDVFAVAKAFEEISPWYDLYDIPLSRNIY